MPPENVRLRYIDNVGVVDPGGILRRRELDAHGIPILPNVTIDAQRKAYEMLQRVAKAVGATEFSDMMATHMGLVPPTYSLSLREQTFLVDYRIISFVGQSPFNPTRMEIRATTCYQVADSMPMPEKIAVALLRLRQAPEQFHFLMRNPGDWIGGARYYGERHPAYENFRAARAVMPMPPNPYDIPF